MTVNPMHAQEFLTESSGRLKLEWSNRKKRHTHSFCSSSLLHFKNPISFQLAFFFLFRFPSLIHFCFLSFFRWAPPSVCKLLRWFLYMWHRTPFDLRCSVIQSVTFSKMSRRDFKKKSQRIRTVSHGVHLCGNNTRFMNKNKVFRSINCSVYVCVCGI